MSSKRDDALKVAAMIASGLASRDGWNIEGYRGDDIEVIVDFADKIVEEVDRRTNAEEAKQ